MTLRKMVCLNIRIMKNDEVRGKRLEKTILEFLMNSRVLGAIVWLGVDGFGRRGRSTVHLEGLMINQPLMIEAVDEREKIEPLLEPLKRLIGDNGFITIHEVSVV
jgi:PII-like signaling protein